MPCRICGRSGHNRSRCVIAPALYVCAEVRDYEGWRFLSELTRARVNRGLVADTNDRRSVSQQLNIRYYNEHYPETFRSWEENQLVRALPYPILSPPPRVVADPPHSGGMDFDRYFELIGDRLVVSQPAPPPPPPVVRSPIPKHIAKIVYHSGTEVECVICFEKPTEEDFALSKCGHNYCQKCYTDRRLDKCGVCREETF